MWSDRQTDMAKLIYGFLQLFLASAPKNGIIIKITHFLLLYSVVIKRFKVCFNQCDIFGSNAGNSHTQNSSLSTV
jgi:hypothetical protein